VSELLDASIPQLADRIARGDVGAEELTRASLERIERRADLNAFLHVGVERALAAARDIDRRRARGEALGPLAGVPIAVKDALCTSDAPTTCGSKILVARPA
jgi:aspartyl-tRNA(Asn)/glutamyl-tRNA(Gln) amidotransferase subunit A